MISILRRLLPFIVLALTACSQSTHFVSTDITGANFGRDFALTDDTGHLRHLSDYKGKAVVLFFGYTQCPDVCPTTLAGLAAAMKLLGADAKRVQVLFVTVDPERDTQALLAAYVPQFYPTFVGLRGDTATTAATAKEFRIYYRKVAGSTPQNYTIDHTASSYAYDPQGRLRLLIRHGETPQNIAADLKLLLDGK